jgi:hypothetical protein
MLNWRLMINAPYFTDYMQLERNVVHFSYKFKRVLLSGMLMKALHNGKMKEIAVDSE